MVKWAGVIKEDMGSLDTPKLHEIGREKLQSYGTTLSAEAGHFQLWGFGNATRYTHGIPSQGYSQGTVCEIQEKVQSVL